MVALLILPLVVVLALWWERRRQRAFAADASTFACRIRACGRAPAEWRCLRRRWSRWMPARWSGELLVIRRGPVFERSVRLAAQVTPEGVHVVPGRGWHSGWNLIAVRMRTASGAVIEVVTYGSARAELVGMYVAAAFSDLPAPPVRRRKY